MADTTHSLQTYVSDMLAVEQHVQQPFETQLKDDDFGQYQDTQDVITRLSALTDQHIVNLRSTLERIGGHEASGAKNAVSSVVGSVAGLIDKARKTKVSKALRDDYAALSFAIVSYEELLATANGMGETEVSTLAKRHLEDYARMVMELGECIPAVVVRELSDDGIQVDTATSEQTRTQIRNIWRSGAQSEHGNEATTSPRSTRGELGLEQDEPFGSPTSGTPTV